MEEYGRDIAAVQTQLSKQVHNDSWTCAFKTNSLFKFHFFVLHLGNF